MTIAVLALVVIALVMRLYDLGARAMHHDESLHATFAWYLADRGEYRHDPLMHGPLQFHLIAALFKLFGDGETMARVPAALAGSALVASPLLLRRWLGGAGTILAALFLALSPTLLYFSRFVRNDLLIALWTVLLVTAVWRYRERGGTRWLALVAAMLGLSFATKETAYITVAILLLYLNAALASAVVTQRGSRGRRRALEMAAALPVAWAIAAVWRPLAGRLRLGMRPREADLLVVLGTLTLPFLAAGVQLPIETLGGSVDGDSEFRIGTAAVLLLFVAAAAVGLSWDWRRWAPLAAICYLVALPLFTTGFTNPDGFGSAFWGSLDYWLDQQDVRRGTQPGFYYLMMVPLYEFLTLLPALVGGVWLLLRGDRFARLLMWWFLATLVALSLAGEKMPWLTTHLALPLALLAARALGVAVPLAARALWSRRRPIAVWAGAGAGSAVALLLLVLSVRTAVDVTYVHADTPVEPLIYTQTSPDVLALITEIESFADAGPGRDGLTITVDTTASFTWPWAWYLRRFPSVRYESAQTIADGTKAEGVLIASNSTLGRNPDLRGLYATERPYRHRWWFPEAGYRRTTLRSLFDGMLDGSLPADWLDFYLRRSDERPLGSIDGAVLFPRRPAELTTAP